MSNVLDEKAIANIPTIRSGDRVQFNLFEGSFSFWRKNPEDDSTWIQIKSLNLKSEYEYEGYVLPFVDSLSKDFGLSYKKIEDPKSSRGTPIFEFI